MAERKKNRYLAIVYEQKLPFFLGEKRKKAIEMAIAILKDKCRKSIELGMKKNNVKGVNADNAEYSIDVGLFKVTVAARLVIPRLAYKSK